MDKYAAKLNDYLISYKNAIASKYLEFSTLLKMRSITRQDFDIAANKVNYFDRVASNIKFFFQDDCTDIFNYYYELSLHLLDPTFTEKDVYYILRLAVIKNHENSSDSQTELINLEAIQKHDFKSFGHFQVQSMVESGRLKDLLNGTAQNVTEEEIDFFEELIQDKDKFRISIEDFIIKIEEAYASIDNFESVEATSKLKSSLEKLGVCEECLNKMQKYLDLKLKKHQEKKKKEDTRELENFQNIKDRDNMKVIEKYLLTLEEIKDFVIEEEKNETLENIKEDSRVVEFQMTTHELVNERTGGKALSDLNLLIDYFSKSEEECLNGNILFRNFYLASDYMRNIPGIKTIDAYQLIATIVRRNHKITEKSPNKLVFDLEALKRINFKTITQERVLEIFKDENTLKKYAKDEGLTEEEQIQRKEIGKHLDELVHDYRDFCKNNDDFYKNFVQIFPNITLESIIEGLKCLNELGVSADLLYDFKNAFLSIFRTNLHKSMETLDLELNHVYLEILIEEEKEREKIEKEIINHNNLVSLKKESASKEGTKANINEVPVKVYLTEKEVRELKKYIREFYDTYHARIVKLPNYEELIECINKLEKLEEGIYAVQRFLSLTLSEILALKDANYLNDYEKLITLIGYLIKYKVPRDKIDMLIRQYKKLKHRSSDLVEALKESLDEIRTYDESLAEDTEMLLSEIEVSSKEDYDAIISLLEEIFRSLGKYEVRTDYEYKKGLEKLGS